MNFKITVDLKQLGVADETEKIIIEFKKDAEDDSCSHSIDESIFDKEENENVFAMFFSEEDIRKVMDWLAFDLYPEISSLNFLKTLLNLAVNQRRYNSSRYDSDYKAEEKNKIEDDWDFSDSGEDDWYEKACKKLEEELGDLNG
ncbi:hypothetical protein HW132_36500, partial [Brasilonema sp. CT11]|nr:hypothetical protein [Brasilonema sp. CT11]